MSLPQTAAANDQLACNALRELLARVDWTRIPDHLRFSLSLLQSELAAWRPLREIVLDVQDLAHAADEATNN